MDAIEKENSKLKGLLYKEFALKKIPSSIGKLIDLFSTVTFNSADHKSADVLGQAYEYFLGQFALAEGKGAGAFYTPESIVKTIVEILAPKKGRLYEPAIGSGGMVVQSEKFMESHGGEKGDLYIYGQEYTLTTWKMAAMNLILRGLDFDLGSENADTLLRDLHPDLRADYVMANPPFNQADWGASKVAEDVRWKYGVPPNSNANYAWVQHIIHHLNDTGRAGVVMPNGFLTTNTNGENLIREKIIKDDLIDCVVALPSKLFINTQIPACLVFINKNKKQKKHTLFIDARSLGQLMDGSRTQWIFTQDHIGQMTSVYHAWSSGDDSYQNELGFCASVEMADIQKHGYILSPGRYVGAAEGDAVDDEVFADKMAQLTDQLAEQLAESEIITSKIKKGLGVLNCTQN